MSKVDIPLSEQQHGQLTEKMARLACAAYYRAKLEPLYFGKNESLDLERRLKKIVEENWTDWTDSAKEERRPVGASDDPRHPAVKPCERLSERAEWRRARAFWFLPPAPPRYWLRRMAQFLSE